MVTARISIPATRSRRRRGKRRCCSCRPRRRGSKSPSRLITPRAVPIHQAVLSAQGQQVHYRLLDSSSPLQTTVRVLDPGDATTLWPRPGRAYHPGAGWLIDPKTGGPDQVGRSLNANCARCWGTPSRSGLARCRNPRVSCDSCDPQFELRANAHTTELATQRPFVALGLVPPAGFEPATHGLGMVRQ